MAFTLSSSGYKINIQYRNLEPRLKNKRYQYKRLYKDDTFVLLQAKMLGLKPRPLKSLTLCCVGLVFCKQLDHIMLDIVRIKTPKETSLKRLACSPTTFNTGTRLTWIKQKFSEPGKMLNTHSLSKSF